MKRAGLVQCRMKVYQCYQSQCHAPHLSVSIGAVLPVSIESQCCSKLVPKILCSKIRYEITKKTYDINMGNVQ